MAPDMKGKVSRVTQVEAPRFDAARHPENNHLPLCTYCDQPISLLEDAFCLVPGQWMPNRDVGNAMFVLDPDVQVQIMQLPNNQLALVTDAHTAKHAHQECFEQIKNEVLGEMPMYEEEFHR